MHDTNPFESMRLGPRAQGVQEHFERSKWFIQLANETSDPVAKFRFLVAAAYSARALVEIMLEAAEQQELKAFANSDARRSRKDFEANLPSMLPHYHLIEKVRIHDFHRFGCLPADPQVTRVFFGGPIKLVARNGVAIATVTESGPQNIVSGQSRVQKQRPLCWNDEQVFDDFSGRYLGLDRVLAEYLQQVPLAIKAFEGWLRAEPSVAAEPPHSHDAPDS